MEVPNQLSISNTNNINGIYTRQEDINDKPSWINEEGNIRICYEDSNWIINNTITEEIYFAAPKWPKVEVVE